MKKTVIAFGSFDIIHPGHLHYLRGASSYGNLVVVVARDESVEKLKGRKPLMDENSRLEMIGSIKFVHRAMLGHKIRKWNEIYNILLDVRPDVIALGYDQKVDMNYLVRFLEENGLNAKIVRITPFKGAKFKSSKLRKLILCY